MNRRFCVVSFEKNSKIPPSKSLSWKNIWSDVINNSNISSNQLDRPRGSAVKQTLSQQSECEPCFRLELEKASSFTQGFSRRSETSMKPLLRGGEA